jgi:RNA polymerase sigma-70 factor (ECF subfamily)
MNLDGERRTDEDLVSELQDGSEGSSPAFDELVQRHQGKVLANCRYLTRSSVDAEDLAQEVFVKAYFGLERFEGRSSFRTWLHRIKVNHCLGFLAKRKGKVFLDIEEESIKGRDELKSRVRADARLQARSRQERIGAILDELSDTLRIPLVLRDLDGLSYEDIAEQLGVGLSAVKMRIKRGREEFRRLWSAQQAPPDEKGMTSNT